MQANVYNTNHEQVGTVELADDVFGVPVREGLLWQQVVAQRASRRRGTHATKTRGEVSGGGAKPHKQKGTGRARQGSRRAPNHVGGGLCFWAPSSGLQLPPAAKCPESSLAKCVVVGGSKQCVADPGCF